MKLPGVFCVLGCSQELARSTAAGTADDQERWQGRFVETKALIQAVDDRVHKGMQQLAADFETRISAMHTDIVREIYGMKHHAGM